MAQAVTFIIEVWVPTIDTDYDQRCQIAHKLNENKVVASKSVTTQAIANVSEVRFFFGIDAKVFEDAMTIGLSTFKRTWNEVDGRPLRIMRYIVIQGQEWTKPNE